MISTIEKRNNNSIGIKRNKIIFFFNLWHKYLRIHFFKGRSNVIDGDKFNKGVLLAVDSAYKKKFIYVKMVAIFQDFSRKNLKILKKFQYR